MKLKLKKQFGYRPPPAPPINIIFFYESSSPYLKNDATCLDFWTDTYIKTHLNFKQKVCKLRIQVYTINERF